MNTVRLVQIPLAGDSAQEKREQRDMFLRRDGGIHAVKLGRVLRAEVRQRFHLHEGDRCVGALGFDPVERRLEIRAEGGNGNASQTVVRACLYHQHAKPSAQQPRQTIDQSRRRLATHAGVHDFERQSRRIDLPLNHHRIGAVRSEAQTSGEARSGKQHDASRRRRWGGGGGNGAAVRLGMAPTIRWH